MAHALTERFVATDNSHIPGHTFSGIMHVWFHDSGGLGSALETELIARYTLTAEQITTVNDIKTEFDGMTPAGKVEYTASIQAGLSLLESGAITTDQFETLLGID